MLEEITGRNASMLICTRGGHNLTDDVIDVELQDELILGRRKHCSPEESVSKPLIEAAAISFDANLKCLL